jgi:hypothetical protein
VCRPSEEEISDERAEPGDRPADDQRLDRVGALVGVDGLDVGVVAGHVVVEQDAVAAEDVAGHRAASYAATACPSASQATVWRDLASIVFVSTNSRWPPRDLGVAVLPHAHQHGASALVEVRPDVDEVGGARECQVGAPGGAVSVTSVTSVTAALLRSDGGVEPITPPLAPQAWPGRDAQPVGTPWSSPGAAVRPATFVCS